MVGVYFILHMLSFYFLGKSPFILVSSNTELTVACWAIQQRASNCTLLWNVAPYLCCIQSSNDLCRASYFKPVLWISWWVWSSHRCLGQATRSPVLADCQLRKVPSYTSTFERHVNLISCVLALGHLFSAFIWRLWGHTWFCTALFRSVNHPGPNSINCGQVFNTCSPSRQGWIYRE